MTKDGNICYDLECKKNVFADKAGSRTCSILRGIKVGEGANVQRQRETEREIYGKIEANTP